MGFSYHSIIHNFNLYHNLRFAYVAQQYRITNLEINYILHALHWPINGIISEIGCSSIPKFYIARNHAQKGIERNTKAKTNWICDSFRFVSKSLKNLISWYEFKEGEKNVQTFKSKSRVQFERRIKNTQKKQHIKW